MCKGSILGTHEYMSGMAACWHRWEAANGNPALADLYIDTMDALDAINDNAIYFIEVSAPELHGILRSHCGPALRALRVPALYVLGGVLLHLADLAQATDVVTSKSSALHLPAEV